MKKPQLAKRLRNFSLLDAPGHLLRRNHQRSFEIFSRLVGEDVTRQQIALLIALANHPGSSQRELVGVTGIDKSTMKEMLGRMIAKGWIARERDINDSRAWTLHLTESGSDLLIEKMDNVEEAQREILAPLGEADRDIFLGYLRLLAGIKQRT